MSALGISTQDAKFEFLQLLVAQLQNQDPIEPVKQEQFINQLTAFSTLEGIESLKVSFDEMLKVQQLGQGFDLAGKEVRYVEDDQTFTGKVDEVTVLGGSLYALIGDKSIPISKIISTIG